METGDPENLERRFQGLHVLMSKVTCHDETLPDLGSVKSSAQETGSDMKA